MNSEIRERVSSGSDEMADNSILLNRRTSNDSNRKHLKTWYGDGWNDCALASSSSSSYSRAQYSYYHYYLRGGTYSSHIKKQIIQEMRIRWSLLSEKAKMALRIFVAIWTLQILMSVADSMYRYQTAPNVFLDPSSIQRKKSRVRDETRTIQSSSSSFFAVVINTYKRPNMLRDAVQHYGATCGPRVGVTQVFVVWSELDVEPPLPENLFQETKQSRSFLRIPARNQLRSKVTVIRAPRDSLNSRFLPIANLQSNAVFMVDDDVRVDCTSLQRGFEAWKANPSSMVGYYPRLAAPASAATGQRQNGADDAAAAAAGKKKKHYVYQAWPVVWWRQSMNFVLTKASFFHADYLALYSDPSKHPTEILQYVDQHMNCEDVAMALLVANVTTTTHAAVAAPQNNQRRSGSTISSPLPPPPSPPPPPMIYVEGSISDKGLFNGISTKQGGTGHMNVRSQCLDDLTHIYTLHGWPRPLDAVYSLRQSSWVPHLSGWQYRPSNPFEWGALENIFK